MKKVVIFSVNANDNPYEDLARQDRMINFLVENEYEFTLGAEVYKGTVTPMFFVHGVNNFFHLMGEGKVTRVIAVDRLENVWVELHTGVGFELGKLVELKVEEVGKHEWVLYEHGQEKYYTAIKE